MSLTGSYLLLYYCLTEYQHKRAHYFHHQSIHPRMIDFGIGIWYSHLCTIGFITPIYASNFYILIQYKINREKEGHCSAKLK